MTRKAGTRIAVCAVGLLLATRLAITLRTGVVTGDDIDLLADCFRWWQDGETIALSTIYGSAGLIYAGFHHFAWAALAGLTSFQLGPLFTVHALLMVAPSLLLAWQLRGRAEAHWAVLFALSSPHVAYLFEALLPLWWLSQIGGSIALHVATREEQGKPLGKVGLFLVGAASGYLCSVYPSLSALTLGLFAWMVLRRKALAQHAAYLGGCVAGCIPYLYLLLTNWEFLNPRLQVGDGAVSLLQLFASIFRNLGVPYVSQHPNGDTIWLVWEQRLSELSPWLWFGAAVVCVAAAAVELRARRRLPAPVELGFCAWGALMLFSFVTHTEKAYHQAGNVWWVPAVLLPWAVQLLWRQHAVQVLLPLLCLNVTGLGVMLGPRLIAGTTADPLHGGRGLGASWWMQQEVIREIRDRAQAELAVGIDRPIAVRRDELYYIQHSLPKLFAIQHPELHDKVKWVAAGLASGDLVVTREQANPNRLRVSPMSDAWHHSDRPERREIRISSARTWDHPVQVQLDLPSATHPSLVLTDSKGTALPFTVEATDREDLVWIKLPSLAQGITTVWAYSGGPARTSPAFSPEDVFDFFDGFDTDLSPWKTLGTGTWAVHDGIAIASLPPLAPDSTSTQLLLDRAPQTAGLVEARLRFPHFKTAVDAGVVFASRPGAHAYLWNLTGYGVTMLSQIDATGTPRTLTAFAGHWKAKPETWYVIGAAWQGNDIQAWADGWTGRRTIVETINRDESGLGQVGLGVKPGPGVPPTEASVEFDWVRIRTSFEEHAPKVSIGKPETRK